MEITLGNIYSKIITTEIIPLRKHLSVFIKGAWFSKAYKEKKWDGRSYFITKNGVFLTGLLSIILEYCVNNNIKYTIIDNRNLPKISIPELKNIKVIGKNVDQRDYQIKSIYVALKRKRGILHLATNAGKTEISCSITKYINLPTLFLVHTIDLFYQGKERFEERLDINCGIIGDTEYDPKKTTVATVQTLANKLNGPLLETKRWEKLKIELKKKKSLPKKYQFYFNKHKEKLKILNQEKLKIKTYLKTIQLVFIDECHHQQSNTWMIILKHTPAPFRFGLSATPFDNDNASDWKLKGMTGKVIYQITNQDLIKLGYSAKPYIYIFKYKQKEYSNTISWSDIYQAAIVNNKTRNNLIKQTIKTLTGTTLIIVRLIKHGLILKQLISNSTFVNGKESTDYRKSVMQNVKNGSIKILIATSIYDEGIDIPNFNNLIIAHAGKSDRKTVQRIGRVLREKKTGNNTALVFDFYDNGNHIKDHAKQRIFSCKREGFDVKIIKSTDEIKDLL